MDTMSNKNNLTILYFIGFVFCCVVQTGLAEEDIKLKLPPRPARIYTQARAGVIVTILRAVPIEPANISLSDCEFQYELEEKEDFTHFHIDECDGSIETAKNITRNVGEYYHVIVTARRNDSQSAEVTVKISIEVTSYNQKAPVLNNIHYSQEILVVAPIGTILMTVNGTDEGEQKSGDKLYYFFQNPSHTGLNPWLYPTSKPLEINYTTGVVKVSSSLYGMPELTHFYIGVADGGSPQRSAISKLTLYIRNMSAPRNLKAVSTSESSIKLCWSPPILGSPDGYRITYNLKNSRFSEKKIPPGVVNLTVEALYEDGQVYHGYGLRNEKVKKLSGISNLTNLTFCQSIENLQIFTLYIVKVTGWSFGGHLSMTSSPITVVTKKRDCSSDLCNNGICQEKRSPPGYICICMNGFAGLHCDKLDPCAENETPCKNGTCKWSDESPPNCLCDDKFFGSQCQWLNPCDESKCQSGGTCVAVIEDEYSCECPPLFTGIHCETQLSDVHKLFSDYNPYCPAAKTKHDFGILEWPLTYAGNEAIVYCSKKLKNAKKITEDVSRESSFSLLKMKERISSKIFNRTQDTRARRECRKDKFGKSHWTEPNVTSCEGEEIPEIPALNIFKAENISHKMLRKSVDKISNSVVQKFNKNKGRKIIKVLSKFLKVNTTKLRSSPEFRQSAKKILNVIKNFVENIKLKIGEQVELREDNIFVLAKLLRKTDLPAEISFTPQEDSSDSKKIDFFKIPKSAVDKVSGEELRFKFVSFKDDRMFVNKMARKFLNMPVFSVSVGNASIHNIDPPVTYSIVNNLAEDTSASCVFWNEHDNSWSVEGLTTTVTSDGRVLCESNHLTAFSVLLDPVNTDMGSHSKILSIITYIGLTISTLALVITISTFILFRSLRMDKSGTIVVNLSISLLLLNLCFIFASVLSTSQGTCILFAVLLHYSVACAFAWMLIEALNMHQLLVTVFPSVETHFLLKRLFFGWICPLLFVGVALSWDYQVYTTERTDICVISPVKAPAVYYTTYFAPMVLVLFLNCTVFGLVLRVLCQRRPGSIKNKDPTNKSSYKKPPVTLAQIRGAITVVALLGVTWISGPFAVGSARLFFQYLFCITNPLQGFTIFVIRVMYNTDARTSWYYFILYGIRGRQKLPRSSLQTHSSCQNTSSLNTQSTSGTPPTVFESALRAARRLSSAGSNYMSKSKVPTKNKRQLSSATCKNVTSQEQLPDQEKLKLEDKLYCNVKDYNSTGDQNKLTNTIHNLGKDISAKTKEEDDNGKDVENYNKNVNSNVLMNEKYPGIKLESDNNRDSFLIPEIENKRDRGLFSSDFSSEIFSDIKFIQDKSDETVSVAEEEVTLQDHTLGTFMGDSRLKPIFNPSANFLKVHSSSNLQSEKDGIHEIIPQIKASSMYHMESLVSNVAVQPASKSKLSRFSSENTLDKIQDSDDLPLLKRDSYTKSTVDKEPQKRHHRLNPD